MPEHQELESEKALRKALARAVNTEARLKHRIFELEHVLSAYRCGGAGKMPNLPAGDLRAENEALKLQLNSIRAAVPYQIGQAIIAAIDTPGRNTLALPLRIIRILIRR